MCLQPMKMARVIDVNGVITVVPYARIKYDMDVDRYIESFEVGCGKCVECMKEYSTQWSYRVMLEIQTIGLPSCVVTLTYNDSQCDGSVHRRDVQLFMKRLRKHFNGVRIRYFGCGEYGAHGLRPHYHLILEGVDFSQDRYFWSKSKKGNVQYRSPTLEKLWTAGFSTIGDCDLYSVKYSAKYMQKLQPPPSGCEPSFTCMSTHPGWGACALDNCFDEIWQSDKIYRDGCYIKTPRYFLKLLERKHVDVDFIKERRIKKAVQFQRTDQELQKARQNAKKFAKGS